MTTLTNLRNFLTAALLLVTATAFAQTNDTKTKNEKIMKTYMIERDIPNAGLFTEADLKGISQKSCGVLKEMGPSIEWVQSYVSGNKIVCIYKAENEDLIREHGKKGGFPVTKITEISSIISPATAE
ncbi:MAG: DUF4242 domain-containing protein [Bacteroidota bacterium]